MRFVSVLVVGVLIAVLAARAAPDAPAAARSVAAAPGALIDLGALFGPQGNEDEDEPDEADGDATAPRAGADQGTHTSLRVVLLSLLLGAMGGAVVANRLRRARERLMGRWRARG
jgi:hypothetical protein